MSLTDEQLRQIDAKEFKDKTGMTKTQYRNIRAVFHMMQELGGSLTIWAHKDDKRNIREILGKGIDVIYVTRIQRERSG